MLRTTTTTVAPPRPPRLPPPRATEGGASSGSAGSADNAPADSSVVRTATTPPSRPPTSFAAGPQLDKAARRFAAGVKAGLTADEMVAMEIGGVPNFADLTPPQREYAQAVKRKLEQRAEELAKEEAERRAREAKNFELGKKLYERGEYRACVEALERGVEDAGGRGTQLGGECAMWLALGYQALGREEQCLELYRWLEQNHPNKKLRKQAADLRYILEAPKLELSPDERVTVPLISSDDAWRQGGRRSSAASSLRKKGGGGGAGKGERKPWERDLDVELQFLPDKWYVRVAWVAVIVGSGVYGNWVAKQQQQVQALTGTGSTVVVEQRTQQQQQQQALSSLPMASAPMLRAR